MPRRRKVAAEVKLRVFQFVVLGLHGRKCLVYATAALTLGQSRRCQRIPSNWSGHCG